MARGEKPPEDRGKVKFRFVEFEMEGGSSNLEETIKSIAHAITRGSPVPTRVVAPTKAPSAGMLSPPPVSGNGDADTGLQHEQVEDSVPEDDSADDDREAAKFPRERKFRAPKFLDELDLDTDPSFRSFAEEYNPQSDTAKYLVIAAWFKLHRATEGIGADQAFTGYKKMRWTERKDVSQPFRDLKREHFFKSSKTGVWEITQLGIDELERIKNKTRE